MNQSLDRALRLLDLLSSGTRRLGPLADAVGLHKSTVLRLLQTYEARGLVRRQGEPPEFLLGFHLLELSQSLLDGLDLRQVAAEPLKKLGAETGETIHLAIRDGSEIVYLDKVESIHPVRMYSRVGARAPVHCTGVGKILLAFSDESSWPQMDLHRYTDETITTVAGLREASAKIRARGWGWDEREHEDEIRCIAAPVFGTSGPHAVAAVSVSVPASRVSRPELDTWVGVLLDACDAITRGMGGRVAPRTTSREAQPAGS